MITDLPAKITPEGLTIAETYLIQGNLQDTANALLMEPHEVSDYLQTREVKAYIDHAYLEGGYRNRNKIADALDNIIDLKLEEMAESEMGSTKDIADLIMMAHKMRMEELKAMESTIKIQTQNNVVITDAGGSNYNKLLEKIHNG